MTGTAREETKRLKPRRLQREGPQRGRLLVGSTATGRQAGSCASAATAGFPGLAPFAQGSLTAGQHPPLLCCMRAISGVNLPCLGLVAGPQSQSPSQPATLLAHPTQPHLKPRKVSPGQITPSLSGSQNATCCCSLQGRGAWTGAARHGAAVGASHMAPQPPVASCCNAGVHCTAQQVAAHTLMSGGS